MGFGSLFRSRSQENRRPKARPLQRSNTHYAGYPNTNAAIAAYEMAKREYEQQETCIMKWEIEMRNKNQAECKYRMDAADHSLKQEQKRVDHMLAYENEQATRRWKRFEIDDKQLKKARALLQKRKETELGSAARWHQQKLADAQKVFFAKGEQIAADAGAGLRRAKAKMVAAKRIRC